jgi:preprotein translocase subunit SecG
MENVLLTVHLLLALLLIGVVLLQRSEGGGLGMGGGGGNISGRPATTPMAKLTWVFAAAFIATSIALTILAANQARNGSVVDAIAPATDAAPVAEDAAPGLQPGQDLLPPTTTDPATPPRADEPAPATND